MTDASLSDRVEAAQPRLNDPRIVALMEWLNEAGVVFAYAVDVPFANQLTEFEMCRDLIAAADACEAERNPNPTAALRVERDDARAIREALATVIRLCDEAGTPLTEVPNLLADIETRGALLWGDRWWGSEDVHREAAE